MQKYFILMADIINSSTINARDQMMIRFKEITSQIAKRSAGSFLSPVTITLGDEFQSVVKNLEEGVSVILSLEETLLRMYKPFDLRYVLYYGPIDTPINEQIAYEMYGEGLSGARNTLNKMKKSSDNRFLIKLDKEENSLYLTGLFRIFQSFYDGWTVNDSKFVASFLDNKDYKKVAVEMQRDPSAMWRRKRTLKIEEYMIIRSIIIQSVKYLSNA